MVLSYIAYSTVAAMGTIALLRFAHNIRKYAQSTKANRCFIIAVYGMAVCAMMEALYCIHESGMVTNPVFCYATECCYSFASLVSAYFWCACSELEQNAWIIRTKKRKILVTLPFVLMELAVLSTPFTHFIFYFTPEGHYIRGILNNTLVIVSAICIAKSGLCALVKSFKAEYYLKRKLYRTFFYYALGLLVAQVFQVIFGSVLPFRIIGAVFVFYLVQEHIFKQNIYIDNLSNANNRTAMEQYLRVHFDDGGERFAYVMIDMDAFKFINDHYGHSTGDKVIALISNAFKLALPDDLFFGRYGGDEFCIIGTVESAEAIEGLIQAARKNIRFLSEEAGFDFCPEFSYGVAYKVKGMKSIPELINQADAAMYENKQARKAVR